MSENGFPGGACQKVRQPHSAQDRLMRHTCLKGRALKLIFAAAIRAQFATPAFYCTAHSALLPAGGPPNPGMLLVTPWPGGTGVAGVVMFCTYPNWPAENNTTPPWLVTLMMPSATSRCRPLAGTCPSLLVRFWQSSWQNSNP